MSDRKPGFKHRELSHGDSANPGNMYPENNRKPKKLDKKGINEHRRTKHVDE
ncbi:hypothetical protein [Legionella jordanis]|uniref:Uncharacterized protein n=1 Tax=Legionella jordanis TaxID=456 RepID=A0A0W0V7X6_9GAMM|nr:hypothetical protein [Legionella jordanis]KTD16242.1 hypothetical protein Ljor_0548 [Legionella jordanis]VEH12300.1 Uncharacterised protein [Legionella jordanis]